MTLNDFKGMGWTKAKKALQDNLVVMALSQDANTHECAKAIRDVGVDAGIAVLCSHFFFAKYGAKTTLFKAIEVHKDSLKRFEGQGLDVSGRRDQIRDIEQWAAWLGVVNLSKAKWPLYPRFQSPAKLAGMANIMMFKAVMNLGGSNTEMIVKSVVLDFLGQSTRNSKNRMVS